MSQLLLILISALIVNNVVLSQFLGLCPLMGASRRLDTALGLGLATLFVMTLATMTTFLVDHAVLTPFGAGHLRTLVFIGLIAAVVQASELGMKAYSPRLFEALGLYLPLITTNCAVLGVTLLSARKDASFLETLFSALEPLWDSFWFWCFSVAYENVSRSPTFQNPFRGPPSA